MNVNIRDGSWVQTQTSALERRSFYLNPANTEAEVSWMVSVEGLSHCGDNHVVKGIGTGCLVLELGLCCPKQQECLCVVTWATGHELNSHYYISYCKIRVTHPPTHLCSPAPASLTINLFLSWLGYTADMLILKIQTKKMFILLWWNKAFQNNHDL